MAHTVGRAVSRGCKGRVCGSIWCVRSCCRQGGAVSAQHPHQQYQQQQQVTGQRTHQWLSTAASMSPTGTCSEAALRRHRSSLGPPSNNNLAGGGGGGDDSGGDSGGVINISIISWHAGGAREGEGEGGRERDSGSMLRSQAPNCYTCFHCCCCDCWLIV